MSTRKLSSLFVTVILAVTSLLIVFWLLGRHPAPAHAGRQYSIAGSTVTPDHTSYLSGSPNTYTITVHNASTDAEWLDQVTVTFPISWIIGMMLADSQDSCANLVSFDATGFGNYRATFTDNDGGFGEIWDGCSWNAVLIVVVPPFATGDQTVTWSLSGDEFGDPPYDINGDFILTSSSGPDLRVTKQADPNHVQPGERVTYTLRVTNTGTVDLRAVITDTLPDHVAPTGVLTWTPPVIVALGGVWTKTVVVTADIGYVGSLTNVVRVTTDEGATDAYTNVIAAATAAPDIRVSPSALTATLLLGTSTVVPFTLTNRGELSATFELQETNGGFLQASRSAAPFSAVPVPASTAPPESLTPAQRLNRGEKGNQPTNRVMGAGSVLHYWPTGLVLTWGAAYDMLHDKVWVGSPCSGWGGNCKDAEYTTSGSVTGREYSFPWSPTNGPADMTYNPNTGMVWQVDVGVDNCIHELNPATGWTGNTICDPNGVWSSASMRALAYDPDTDTYFTGRWTFSGCAAGICETIFHYKGETWDNPGQILEQHSVPGVWIAGMAYHKGARSLFVVENNAPDTIHEYNIDTWSQVNSFTVSGWADYSGAGMDINCDGNLWMANQISNTMYLVDSGRAGNLCSTDVPWLSESPITGTIAAGGNQVIAVTFDANVVLQMGQYYATLRALSNDPFNPVYTVPVTMTVQSTQAPDITVSPPTLSAMLNSGQGNIQTLTIGNVGDAGLTWNVAENPAVVWLGELPSSGTVASGGSADVDVTFDATGQSSGVYATTLRITSNDPGTPVVSVPVTLIVSNTIYLPCIAKNYCPGFPYFDDFSNPNSGWGSGDTTRRKYGYLNGEYQILIKGTDDGFWITPDLVLPGSYVIEVDARHASSATGAYGLRFGMRWDGSGKLIEFYQFLMDPLIRKYLLEKYKNGSWQTLIGWTYDSRINQYATNHLGISRIGTAIYIDVNYARLGTAYDGDFTSAGRDAGLIVLSGESAPVDFRFDNFSVTCQ